MGDWDFWDWCLAGLFTCVGALALLIFFLFALPRAPLVIPATQDALNVGALDDFPVNSSRLERWGSDLILVVRAEEDEVTAVAGVSPGDGCVLEWNEETQQVVSPCSYEAYNHHGGVIDGLHDAPLSTYPVRIRDNNVYIGSRR